jgi:hypothetical protein
LKQGEEQDDTRLTVLPKQSHATFLNYGEHPTSERASEFFTFVRRRSYAGAEPEQARSWIEDNIDTRGKITIGAARLRLFGQGRMHALRIAALEMTPE